jgi:hypothetical protein
MKQLLILLSFFTLILVLSGCAKEESYLELGEEWTLDESGQFYYRALTNDEEREYQLSDYRNSCGWSDGQFGSITCNSGTCSVVIIRQALAISNIATQACIRCSGDNSVGACR